MAYTHGLTHDPTTTAYWAGESFYADTLVTEQPTATLGCNTCEIHWNRTTAAGSSEDQATIRFRIAKVVGGGLYSALIPAEFAPIETALNTMWTGMQIKMDPGHTLVEYRWFENRASHGAYPDGSEVVGPPVRITAASIAGTDTNDRLPDQDAMSITFRTAARKHWGRVYVPGLTMINIDKTYGLWTQTAVDTIAAYWHTFLASLITNAQTIGVWTYRRRAFLDISQLEVDNVVDIQRRRRANHSTYKKIYSS